MRVRPGRLVSACPRIAAVMPLSRRSAKLGVKGIVPAVLALLQPGEPPKLKRPQRGASFVPGATCHSLRDLRDDLVEFRLSEHLPPG
jgi:hypothetical protein